MMKNSEKIFKKICPVYNKEFIAKSDSRITCSNSCKSKRAYRKKKHGKIRSYIRNRTVEENLEIQKEYMRNKYKTDERHREYMKVKSKKNIRKKNLENKEEKMRDPNRIDAFLDTLKKVWKTVPDWRFGQLVVNLFDVDPFYLEDDIALKFLETEIIKEAPKTTVIDGKGLAKNIENKIKEFLNDNKEKLHPSLAVIRVGDDPASEVYVRNKKIACENCGIDFFEYKFPKDIGEQEIINTINKIKATVTGILVQAPLPKHLDFNNIMSAIPPEKDVDGLNPINVGKLALGEKCFVPCTPLGIMHLLHSTGINLEGKNIVIIGRSMLVGKPLVQLCLNENATVTCCHSKTKDLKDITKESDILITAIGKPKFINRTYLSPKCKCIIDVGINRDEKNKLCGDCNYDDIISYWETLSLDLKDRYITPVPGGVGPMTIAMLLKNVIQSAREE